MRERHHSLVALVSSAILFGCGEHVERYAPPARHTENARVRPGTVAPAREGELRPYASLVGSRIRLVPSGATFVVPEAWLKWHRSNRNNLHLSHRQLEAVSRPSCEFDTEYHAVVSSVLPFGRCAVHAGGEGWGDGRRRGVSHDDLQMRAYVGGWQPNAVRELIQAKAMRVAKVFSELSRPPITWPPVHKSTRRGEWQVESVAFFLSYGSYGGTANVDFYVRRFGKSTVVLVFMYKEYGHSKSYLARRWAERNERELRTVVDSFSWHDRAQTAAQRTAQPSDGSDAAGDSEGREE